MVEIPSYEAQERVETILCALEIREDRQSSLRKVPMDLLAGVVLRETGMSASNTQIAQALVRIAARN